MKAFALVSRTPPQRGLCLRTRSRKGSPSTSSACDCGCLAVGGEAREAKALLWLLPPVAARRRTSSCPSPGPSWHSLRRWGPSRTARHASPGWCTPRPHGKRLVHSSLWWGACPAALPYSPGCCPEAPRSNSSGPSSTLCTHEQPLASACSGSLAAYPACAAWVTWASHISVLTGTLPHPPLQRSLLWLKGVIGNL